MPDLLTLIGILCNALGLYRYAKALHDPQHGGAEGDGFGGGISVSHRNGAMQHD